MKRIPLFLITAAAVAVVTPVVAAPKTAQVQPIGSQPDAGMVLVPVTVTDGLGRSVTGLDSGAFRLYEDKVEQKVSLQSRNLPLSVGIILDISESMAGRLGDIPAALSAFLPIALAEPGDEACLIEFNDRPALVQGFTHDKDAIENGLAGLEPKGRTALYDAVYLGLTEMEHARNQRKALILISDGFNHGGVYSGADVAALAKKSGVGIYALGFDDVDPVEPGMRVNQAGIETLRVLSEPTGGRAFDATSGMLRDTIAKIGLDLRDQYLLAYTPTNQTHDGKFRKITVKLDAGAGVESPRAYSKSGYYAPAR